MRETPARILYLAVADARGHLMRAHLVRELLGPAGIEVDVVTTSEDGRAFLAGLGTPSRLLSTHFQVEFDAHHDMQRGATDRRVTAYVFSPRRGLRDLARLRAWSRGAALVVNDSLHPALLLAPFAAREMPVVQLYGENLRRAAEANFDGRAPAWLAAAYRRGLGAVFDRSFGEIVHCVGAPLEAAPGARRFRLPTLVPVLDSPPPARREQVVAVYLNPHFRDPAIAEAVERAVPQGFRLDAVGEGYAGRPGWRAQDPHFARVVAAADVFVSGAGMGALELSRVTGTPLLALVSEQPEQQRNARAAAAVVPLSTPGLTAALAWQLRRLSQIRFTPPVTTQAISAAWSSAFEALIHSSQEETPHADRRAGAGDSQPSRGRRRSANHRESVAPARTPEGTDLSAGRAGGAGDHPLRAAGRGA